MRTDHFAYERGNILKVIWETLANLTEESNRLRQETNRVPDAHGTVHRLTHRHTQTYKLYFVLFNILLTRSVVTFCKALQFLPCRDSASPIFWCVRETFCAGESDGYTHTHRDNSCDVQLQLQGRWTQGCWNGSEGSERTGMFRMLRNKDCRVLAASELHGDAKKWMASCLLRSTAMSLVGRRNHWLTYETRVQLITNVFTSNLTAYFFVASWNIMSFWMLPRWPFMVINAIGTMPNLSGSGTLFCQLVF